MKKVFLSNLFIIGLYAYLRRLELSMDRTLREEIKPLKDYCDVNAKPALQEVLDRLSLIGADYKMDLQQNGPSSLPHGFCTMVIAWFQWYSRGGFIMEEDEVRFIYSTLQEISVALNHSQIVDPEVFVPLRIRLSEVGDFRLRCMPKHIRKRIYGVEHLNQNPMLETETIESISNHQDWLAARIEIIL